ncbi:MAG: hypothetical protein VYB35_11510 [Verrucomicrobiota bacterium]|nr:hypothetical protein [Verrucomicrobiota bacterium]
MIELPRYNISKDYNWNYDHAPLPVDIEVPSVSGNWTYCGKTVDSPLGIAAGPLLNGRWLLYYASLGFDILTYKTVRCCERESYGLPNLQPIVWPQDSEFIPEEVKASDAMGDSWAISFGMPSKSPQYWQDDVVETKNHLAKGKFLSVSVVATPEPGQSIDVIAADYARCARWAIDSGADGVEANFSCPNVSSVDGQLYLNPEDAGFVASKLRQSVLGKPLLIKVGHFNSCEVAQRFFTEVAPYVDGLVMVNGLSTLVRNSEGELLFEGRCRGIGGVAIKELVFKQLKWFSGFIANSDLPVSLIGVGGLSESCDVRQALNQGCEAVQFATAAMINPKLGVDIRKEALI